jgi:hypothetical protein
MVYLGKDYLEKRGETRGSSLPLLFVNTNDLLQAAVNDVWHRGLINIPIDNDFGQKYPIIQYADDTLMIMPADVGQVMHLKNIL